MRIKEIQEYSISKLTEFFDNEKNVKIIIAALILLVISIIFKVYIPIIVLTLLGGFSMIHGLWTRNYIGFELCTMAAVLCGMYYGPLVGAIVGMISITIGLFAGVIIDQAFIFVIGMYALIGIFSSYFSFDQVLIVGMIATIISDNILGGIWYITGSNPVTIVMYIVTHQLFNYYLFKLVAPLLISIFF